MEALIIHCICANQNCYGLGVSFLPFLSYGDFSEVIKLKHGNLTMHRSVEVVSAVCCGEWTAEVSSNGTSPRKSHDTSRI